MCARNELPTHTSRRLPGAAALRDNSAMRGGSDDLPPLVFRSKVDGWFRVLPWVGVLVVGAVLVIPVAQGDRAALWFTPALLLPAALPLWLLRTTNYTITGTHVRIRCGPFRWNVPLADVRAVRPTRNALSSPALSLDRLRIRIPPLAGRHGVARRQGRLPE